MFDKMACVSHSTLLQIEVAASNILCNDVDMISAGTAQALWSVSEQCSEAQWLHYWHCWQVHTLRGVQAEHRPGDTAVCYRMSHSFTHSQLELMYTQMSTSWQHTPDTPMPHADRQPQYTQHIHTAQWQSCDGPSTQHGLADQLCTKPPLLTGPQCPLIVSTYFAVSP